MAPMPPNDAQMGAVADSRIKRKLEMDDNGVDAPKAKRRMQPKWARSFTKFWDNYWNSFVKGEECANRGFGGESRCVRANIVAEGTAVGGVRMEPFANGGFGGPSDVAEEEKRTAKNGGAWVPKHDAANCRYCAADDCEDLDNGGFSSKKEKGEDVEHV